MVLFDAKEQRPPSKVLRYFYTVLGTVVTIAVFVAVFPGYLWYPFIYYREKNTARHFLNEVVAGDMKQAYQIWQPTSSYTYPRFMEDWGPEGYYGPVKSFRMERPEHIKNGSSANIIVDVSPYQPFPADDDMVKQNHTKQVQLWVEFKDQSISFPPF